MELTRQISNRLGRTSPLFILFVAVASPSVYYIYNSRRRSSSSVAETAKEELAVVQNKVSSASAVAYDYFTQSVQWIKNKVSKAEDKLVDSKDDFLQRTRRPTDGEIEYKEKKDEEWYPAGPADSPQKKRSSYQFQADESTRAGDDPLFTPTSPAPSLVQPTEYTFHPQLEENVLPEEIKHAIHARSVDQPQYIVGEEPSKEEDQYESLLEGGEEAQRSEEDSDLHQKKGQEATTTASGRDSAIAFGQFVSN